MVARVIDGKAVARHVRAQCRVIAQGLAARGVVPGLAVIIVGDVDFEGVRQKASCISPVPGGVGPMTVTMLVHNTVMAAQRRAADPPMNPANGRQWHGSGARRHPDNAPLRAAHGLDRLFDIIQ